jgi:hypothetical protein
MKKGKQGYILAVIVVLILGYIIWDSLSQPDTKDLKGDFKEVAFYRNEQNTGPVVRIYAVTVSDTVWNDIKSYGNYMAYTKYGNTKVYFFMENANVPQTLQPGEVNFDPQFNKSCVALYEKSAMSQVAFNKYPL